MIADCYSYRFGRWGVYPPASRRGGGNRKIPQVEGVWCHRPGLSNIGRVVDHFLQDLPVFLPGH